MIPSINSRTGCIAGSLVILIGVLYILPIYVEFKYSNEWMYKLSEFIPLKNSNSVLPNVSAAALEETNVTAARPKPIYLVDTPGCKIPAIKFPDRSIKIRQPKSCKSVADVCDLNDPEQIIRLRKGYGDKNECFLTDIVYVPGTSTQFRIGNSTKIDGKQMNVSEREHFAVRCGRQMTFQGNLPLTKTVRAKMEHWRRQKSQLPVSVLFMGIDTTSRLHFHRSLPKTLAILEQMGFYDFKGYETLYPQTTHNFANFLMGLPYIELKKIHKWGQSFDKKPIIWKAFNKNNYVTMYFEDGQSFNAHKTGWKRFQTRQTDYYGFPLHNALKPLVQKYAPKRSLCYSSMDGTEFMLDYTARFATKFKTTPFFSFTWLQSPFHDDPELLYLYDDTFYNFFKRLQDQPDLLKRTLIVLNADHGPRYGNQVEFGYTTFMERTLPPLFVRVPEQLETQFPELRIRDAMEINVNRLTTPLDVHHTYRHILHLFNLTTKIYKGPYKPSTKDRSSLFAPIRDDRTCADVKIWSDSCMCNISADLHEANNPSLNYKLYPFGIAELNKYVRNQSYSKVCQVFTSTKSPTPPISSALLSTGSNYTEMLVRFTVLPLNARFEMKVRIFRESERIDRIGSFDRISSYGNQSWCVDLSTGVDYMLKEICICK